MGSRAERRGCRLSADDPLAPVALTASGSRLRDSHRTHRPANSAAIGFLVEVNALASRCSPAELRLRPCLRDSAALPPRLGGMQERCGVVRTAVEPGPTVLLSRPLEGREQRAGSTGP